MLLLEDGNAHGHLFYVAMQVRCILPADATVSVGKAQVWAAFHGMIGVNPALGIKTVLLHESCRKVTWPQE
eukprot:3957159-Amphidinium_carterae.1